MSCDCDLLHWHGLIRDMVQWNLSWKIAPLAIKIWSLKTGGLCWQVQLHWNVGSSAMWSFMTGGPSWQWPFKTGSTVPCFVLWAHVTIHTLHVLASRQHGCRGVYTNGETTEQHARYVYRYMFFVSMSSTDRGSVAQSKYVSCKRYMFKKIDMITMKTGLPNFKENQIIKSFRLLIVIYGRNVK